MTDIIEKVNQIAINSRRDGEVVFYAYPITKDEYIEMKKAIATGVKCIYKKVTRDNIILFGDTTNIDYSLAEEVIRSEDMWMPAKYDFENRRVSFNKDREGVAHEITQTSDKLKMFKYYISLIGNPQYCIITKVKI